MALCIKFAYFIIDGVCVLHTLARMSKKAEPERRKESVPVPLRLTAELADLVSETAVSVKLSKQDTMRLALERGLTVLRQQLTPDIAA